MTSLQDRHDGTPMNHFPRISDSPGVLPSMFQADRSRVILALVLAAALAAASCGGHKPAARLDSLLLITIDTLRADHVSCYGPSPARTPSLDALASRGALVRNAWATVPLTTPSHASILTGLYPPAHGVRYNSRFRLQDSAETLAERLRAAGRRTAAFVASYTTSRTFGLAQGFETFDDEMGYAADGSERQQRPANEVIDRAAAWLSSHADRPFFLWVHLYDPHAPYEPPAEFAAQHPGDGYSGEVAFADAQVGRLLETLERAGAGPRTVVAALADHGEGLGERGELEHGFLH
jgi:arylsulfatase A-like enzyme